MSAKSAMYRNPGKNPYGNSARRGRGVYIIATVVILMMITAGWTIQYTRFVGAKIKNPPAAQPATPAEKSH
jgi:hypothetical protein